MSLIGVIIVGIAWLGIVVWGIYLFRRRSPKAVNLRTSIIDEPSEQVSEIPVELQVLEEKMGDIKRRNIFSKTFPDTSDFIVQRKKLGLSQRTVGKMLGMSASTISHIEAKRHYPLYSTTQKLVNLYYKENNNSIPNLYSLAKEFKKIRKEKEYTLTYLEEQTGISRQQIKTVEDTKRNSNRDFDYTLIKTLFEFYKKELQNI